MYKCFLYKLPFNVKVIVDVIVDDYLKVILPKEPHLTVHLICKYIGIYSYIGCVAE